MNNGCVYSWKASGKSDILAAILTRVRVLRKIKAQKGDERKMFPNFIPLHVCFGWLTFVINCYTSSHAWLLRYRAALFVLFDLWVMAAVMIYLIENDKRCWPFLTFVGVLPLSAGLSCRRLSDKWHHVELWAKGRNLF